MRNKASCGDTFGFPPGVGTAIGYSPSTGISFLLLSVTFPTPAIRSRRKLTKLGIGEVVSSPSPSWLRSPSGPALGSFWGCFSAREKLYIQRGRSCAYLLYGLAPGAGDPVWVGGSRPATTDPPAFRKSRWSSYFCHTSSSSRDPRYVRAIPLPSRMVAPSA